MSEIVKHPDPVLLKPTSRVEIFQLDELTERMFISMEEAGGMGLASNQIGLAESICVMHVPGYPKMIMVNPVITRTKGEEEKEEGCLSLPGHRMWIKRATTVWVEWQDINGARKTGKFKDLLARCIQHEVDHLNGITINERQHLALEV